MFRADIIEDDSWKDKMEYDGVVYRGPDMVGELCRVLKTGMLEIFRNNKCVMRVDVAKRAKYSLQDGVKVTRMVRYVEMPDAVFSS
jgi:hypothetical protein